MMLRICVLPLLKLRIELSDTAEAAEPATLAQACVWPAGGVLFKGKASMMRMIYSHWGSVVSAGPAGVSSPCMSQSSAQTWWPLPLQSWWPHKDPPRSNALWESPGPQGWSGAVSLRAELKENRPMKQVSIMFNPFKLVLILHIGAPLLLPLWATATSSFFMSFYLLPAAEYPWGRLGWCTCCHLCFLQTQWVPGWQNHWCPAPWSPDLSEGSTQKHRFSLFTL